MYDFLEECEAFKQIQDHPRIFPQRAIDLLQELNLTKFSEFSPNMLELLFQVGKADLSVGRIFEGHINALLLIDTFGTQKQKQHYFKDADNGKLFGVWNTEMPTDGLSISSKDVSGTMNLRGRKTFCSGALHIDRPVVTAKTPYGIQMIVLELDGKHNLVEDWSLWNPIGMCASVSCRIDFTSMPIASRQFLGELDDYYREPFFNWGAVRFSAVQLGGAQKIAQIMLKHLQQSNRSEDPYQQLRIGKISILMETALLWMEKASKIQIDLEDNAAQKKKVNFANMMRTLTLDICEEIISISEKAIGIQGMMKHHPLEKAIRDLRVYLKQAGPDAALANVGKYKNKIRTYE